MATTKPPPPPSSREIITLSVGDLAGAVSTHVMNLQGLAVTTSRTLSAAPVDALSAATTAITKAPLCDPVITHTNTASDASHKPYHVPRGIWLDSPDAFRRRRRLGQQDQQSHGNHPDHHDDMMMDPWIRVQQSAAQLIQGPYSRYRAAAASRPRGSARSGDHQDDHHEEDDEEEEMEEEELEAQRQRLIQRDRRQFEAWFQTTAQPAQEQLETCWDQLLASTDPTSLLPPGTDPTSAPRSNLQQQQGHWVDWFMPPHRPSSLLPLPPSATTWIGDAAGHGDQAAVVTSSSLSYHEALHGSSSRPGSSSWPHWQRDELMDHHLRRLWEECDACQGVMLYASATSSLGEQEEEGGLGPGLTTWLLQEIKDECPGAYRWVISCQPGRVSTASPPPSTLAFAVDQQQATSAYSNEGPSWRTMSIQRLRRNVERGLALYHQADLAHAVLPLDVSAAATAPEQDFAASGLVAAALETITLPFRLQSSQKNSSNVSLIGLNTYCEGSWGGDMPFGSTSQLSFPEFIRCHQRSNYNKNICELELMLPWAAASSSSSRRSLLLQGTAVARDARMKQGPGSAPDGPAGQWALDPAAGGLMTCLTPRLSMDQGQSHDGNRSLHHHFAMSSAYRCSSSDPQGLSTSQEILCLLQGMGIRFRPERSVATVVKQSLAELTENGGGAGSYWKKIWDIHWNNTTPVWAVLSNTTRIYPYLHDTALDMQQALSPRMRTYYNRDVMSGILPEREDCQEALEECLNMRDAYRPPEGSGLAADEEGSYFDS